jgi:predicted MPP superfamily phosphohydrolase
MLWVMSDLHADRGLGDIAVQAPDFDVFVCAGDTLTGDIAGSIEMTAAIARGKPAVFVAGNHEWMSAADPEEVLDEAHEVALREGVHFLECDSAEIGGIRFAGATLWTPLDFRYGSSAKSLQTSRANVVVTHFPPPVNDLRWILRPGKLWIYGHHHGFESSTINGRRLVRNAVGYGAAEDLVDSKPARQDFVIEIEP